MNAARQAWVEAPHGAHDVDALEVIRAVLLEDWSVLHGILVGSRGPEDVTGVCVPGCRGIGVIVGNLTIANHHVMGQHATHSLVESTANGFIGNFEIGPCFGSSAVQ